MNATPTVSIIIPTKNRAADLELAIESLLRQRVLPDELFIIDQSDGDISRARIEQFVRGSSVRLNYIHDPSIAGGAVARNVAMDRAAGEIFLFLDDDVQMEEKFVEELLATYTSHPDISGVSGVVTNYQPPSGLM